MKNINNTNLFNLIKSKGLMLIASSFLLTSCVVYTGGYSETDGVYYDPNKDSLPAGTYSGNYGNQVDDYYSYQDTYPSIYDNNQQNIQDQQNKYLKPLANDSDWGNFTGTETNYTSFNNWGWNGGFGWGGWGNPYYGYGWNNPYNSWGWGVGFGWGWGNSFYSPWGWGGFYDPFWNYGWGGGYYGGLYNHYYNSYYQPVYYNRSGANGRLSGMMPQGRQSSNGFQGINNAFRNPQRFSGNNNGSMRNNPNNNGMRNFPNNNSVRNFPNNGMRNNPNNNGMRNFPNNNGMRNFPNNNGGIRTNPNNGGFRNEGFNNSPSRSGNMGGFNSGGGGFRSGGSSGGGGMRSGGGGRR